uniref:Expansin-like EG45 domain-containing protein n=1 Tax=Kalanchoe fedtschenkoi TaxID=63787 RepID=A0A7N0UT88_KALFE
MKLCNWMLLALAFLIIYFISNASATPGIATFYTNYRPSACYGNQDEGVMIGAASDPLWNNGAICGKYFTVRCTGPTNPYPKSCKGKNSVRIKIVDHCPGCGGTLDLSKEAFAAIADPVAGRIKIDYS